MPNSKRFLSINCSRCGRRFQWRKPPSSVRFAAGRKQCSTLKTQKRQASDAYQSRTADFPVLTWCVLRVFASWWCSLSPLLYPIRYPIPPSIAPSPHPHHANASAKPHEKPSKSPKSLEPRRASEALPPLSAPPTARKQEQISPPRAIPGRKPLKMSPLSATISPFHAPPDLAKPNSPKNFAPSPKLPIVTSVFASTLKRPRHPLHPPATQKIIRPHRQNCCKPVFPW